jgi:ribose transport system ATP-binding protein
MSAEILSLNQVIKTFPGVVALDQVSLRLDSGEILGLVGENGAGKSTLIKIISGIYAADGGEVYICGEKMKNFSPSVAQAAGVSSIYQDFNLVNPLSVTKNILLGRELHMRIPFLVDYPAMKRKAGEILAELGMEIDPNQLVQNLSVSGMQMVEIAKALSTQCRILIMDEPTSSLSSKEIKKLFQIMQQVKSRGVGIIFISHRLDEILKISDRILVLRDGKKISETDTRETTQEQIIIDMVGENIVQSSGSRRIQNDEKVLEVKSIAINKQFEDISFDIHKGEIVGLTGLLGSGGTEIAHALAGVTRVEDGQILVDGKRLRHAEAREAVQAGIGLVPADRKKRGLIMPLDVRSNICAPNQSSLSRMGFRNFKREMELTEQYIRDLDIKCRGFTQPVMFLSGGNQQKVVVAKWLARRPKILILDEPTHGIDIKAKAEIANIIKDLAAGGIGILLISSEIEELLNICDRILVLREGRLVDAMSIQEASKDRLTHSMMGVIAKGSISLQGLA